jgi:hypothetical protein
MHAVAQLESSNRRAEGQHRPGPLLDPPAFEIILSWADEMQALKGQVLKCAGSHKRRTATSGKAAKVLGGPALASNRPSGIEQGEAGWLDSICWQS